MEGTIGELKMFAGNFAPRNWAFCEGQLLAINNNQALFSIIGTTYGGDGRTTFALPDLRGRVVIGPGTGPGLRSYRYGANGGEEHHTLTPNEMPSHTHTTTSSGGSSSPITVKVSSGNATMPTATAGASIATPGTGSGRSFAATNGFNTSAPDVELHAGTATGGGGGGTIAINNNGGSMRHNNMQPWLSLYYIICLQGTFPSRS